MIGHDVVFSWLPVLAVVIPLVGTLVIYLVEYRSWRLRNALSAVTAAITLIVVLDMYPAIRAGKIIEANFPRIIPPLGISFRVDPLSFLLAVTTAFIWLMVTLYSLEYMSHEHHKNRYYPFLILTLSGCLGVVLTGDLFSLFVFFELMSLTAFVLVIHEETPEAMRAGFKYLIMTIVGSLALFFAIVVTYELAGTLKFSLNGFFFDTSLLSFLGFLGYIIGFGVKAGMVPLHVWLPDAHPVAPSPASALLSGLMIKTGAYGLLRVIYNVYGADLIQSMGWYNILIWASAITIFLGSAVAIVQDDIKRRLAYSSIGQMGYILLGMGLFTQSALVGDIFHIFSHAFMKSTLFLCAGAIIYKTGLRKIKDLAGIGKRMPITMGAFTIAAMAMIGIPPLNGFISKWNLSLGALQAGKPFFVFLLLVSSLMNVIYYAPIIITAFMSGDHSKDDSAAHGTDKKRKLFGEVPLAMLIPMIILALGCLVFDLFPENLPLYLATLSARLLFR